MTNKKKRKKTQPSPSTCPCCGRQFSRLLTHYYHSKLCNDSVLQNDKSLVSDVQILGNNQQLVSNNGNKTEHNIPYQIMIINILTIKMMFFLKRVMF